MSWMAPEGGRAVRLLALAGVAGLVFYLVQSLAPALCGDAVTAFAESVLYPVLVAVGGVLAGVRAVVSKRDRLAWGILAAGMLAWAAGDAAAALGGAGGAIPTVSDLLWLAFYPAAYATLILLVRSRLADGRRALWLDGLLAALAVGSVAVAVAWEPVSNAAELAGTLAIDVTYLVGDLLLLGVAAAALVLTRWRPGRPLAWVAAGLGLSALADAFFLYEAAAGLEITTTAPATLWPLGALLIGLGAWQPAAAAPRLRAGRLASLVTPGTAGALALGVLVVGRTGASGDEAAVLAVATLVLVLARVTTGFAENLRLLREAERHAATDALTGLGNRRALMNGLDEALAEGERGEPSALLLFDLDNFKHYNDTFGHPAGDVLLARLGTRLSAAVEGRARAYRLGGDEFCALVYGDEAAALEAGRLATEALSEQGAGFDVGSSSGMVLLPAETTDAAEALQIADRRLYLDKGERRRESVTRQTGDVLLQALEEREPELRGHVGVVGRLAEATAADLGLAREERERISLAARLHDVGKMAVPDAILAKPGPLDEAELGFIRQHTVVGERILRAAPALGNVAQIVRSSHERFDGTGYPDRLAGEEIPLGSRVVAVCDAFSAMTSPRPYSPARRVDEALAELHRCAGSQFDPEVVEAFCTALARHGLQPAPAIERALRLPAAVA